MAIETTAAAQPTSSAANPSTNSPEAKPVEQQSTSDMLYPSSAKATATPAAEPAKAEPTGEVKDPAPEQTDKVEEKPEGGVPEKYDLKLPEGITLDKAQIEKVEDFAKSLGLTNDEAQHFLDMKTDAVTSYVEQQKQQLNQRITEWEETSKKDPEIGGEKFPQAVEIAKRALGKFANKEFVQMLNESGLGSHPDVIRTFARIGKQMSNDTLVHGSAQAAPDKSLGELFYPDSTK